MVVMVLKRKRRSLLILAAAAVCNNSVGHAFVLVSPSSASSFFAPARITTTTPLFQSERVSEQGKDPLVAAADADDASAETTTDDASSSLLASNFATSGAGQATTRLAAGNNNNKPTVWTEFSRIAQEHPEAANLGQGFPDWLPPKFAVDALVAAATDSAAGNVHQYTRPAGHPHLVQQLARRYSLHLKHQEIDAMNEVAVTVGASQALYLSLQTLIQPGDEVILFEPFFDLYVNQVKLAGGTPVFVPLDFEPYNNNNDDDDDDNDRSIITGGDWVLNPETLQSKVNANTKAMILNSPHNPTGKIFTRDEMEHIAAALELAHPDCVVLSDEVYKYIVHSAPTIERNVDDESLFCRGHVHFASLPGMWDRTITISSAGKTFSATGWQIGWCVGPRRLVQRIHQLLPYVQFCASTVLQEALARSLRAADEPYYYGEGGEVQHDSYYDYLRWKYARKRDLLAGALEEAGFAVPDYTRTPGGGFFILARIGKEMAARLPEERRRQVQSGAVRQDWALCQWLAEEKGLLCIPSSPFFSEESRLAGASDEFVRIAFCKTDETIQQAADALRALKAETTTTSTTKVQR